MHSQPIDNPLRINHLRNADGTECILSTKGYGDIRGKISVDGRIVYFLHLDESFPRESYCNKSFVTILVEEREHGNAFMSKHQIEGIIYVDTDHVIPAQPTPIEEPKSSNKKFPPFVNFFLTFLTYCLTIHIIFAFILWDISFIRTVDPLVIRFSMLAIFIIAMRSALEN